MNEETPPPKNDVTDKKCDNPDCERPGFSKLTEGKKELVHDKVIKCLIRKDRDYIVYLDDKNDVWWAVRKGLKLLEGTAAGEILNEVSYLESIETSALRPAQVESFRRMLGEAVARLLDGGGPEQAKTVLRYAREYIAARCDENARVWYLSASSWVTMGVVIVVSLLWIAREAILPNDRAATIILGMAGGALGAFLSILLRSEGLAKDISASRRLYYSEAASKIAVGVIGALVVALGIEGKVFLGNIDPAANHKSLLILFCIVAGASERLIPGLINKVELTDSL